MSQLLMSGEQSTPQHLLSFSFNTSLSSKYSVLISFKIDWFDLFLDPPQICMLKP